MHSDCQIEKGHIYQPLVYNRTYQTEVLQDQTGPAILYRPVQMYQDLTLWKEYEKMGLTENPSCSHEPNVKMHVWSSNGKKGQIYQILVYDRTYKTNFLQDRTRNIFQGPETWEIYDKMGLTENPSCSHEPNFKMHVWSSNGKKATSTRHVDLKNFWNKINHTLFKKLDYSNCK